MKTPLLSTLSVIAISILCDSLPAHAQSVEDLGIQSRSTYQPPSERNPFWPIGWSKPDPNAVAPVVKVEDTSFFTPSRFNLSSISIGNQPLALINGRTYGVGDQIIVGAAAIDVTAIRDGEVELRYRDNSIVIPLKSAPRRAPAK